MFVAALMLAASSLALSTQPAAAEDFGYNSNQSQSGEKHLSAFHRVANEVALLRYRAALQLTAAQQKYWPAAAAALRGLSRQTQLDEAIVRRYAPGLRPLLASLDDHQKQVAMSLAQQAGLAQYASLF